MREKFQCQACEWQGVNRIGHVVVRYSSGSLIVEFRLFKSVCICLPAFTFLNFHYAVLQLCEKLTRIERRPILTRRTGQCSGYHGLRPVAWKNEMFDDVCLFALCVTAR